MRSILIGQRTRAPAPRSSALRDPRCRTRGRGFVLKTPFLEGGQEQLLVIICHNNKVVASRDRVFRLELTF